MANEQIRFDVILNAESVYPEIKGMLDGLTDINMKVVAFSKNIAQMSRNWNVSWQGLLGTFKQINDNMRMMGGQGLFGQTPTGGRDPFDMSSQFLRSAEAGNRYVDTVNRASNANKNFDGSSKRAAEGAKGFSRSINAVRVALGTMVAMGVFRFFNAIEMSMRKAIENSRELEVAMYRLINVERALSKQGVEITPQGMTQMVEDLREQFPFVSTTELVQLTSAMALLTQQAGFSEDQIRELIKAVIVLNINSTQTESIMETMNKTVAPLLAPQARSVAELGLAFGKTAMEAEGLRIGVLKAGQSIESLSFHEKALIKYSIVINTAAEGLDAMNGYLESNDAGLKTNAASWNDLLTVVGGFVTGAAPAIQWAIGGLIKITTTWKLMLVSAVSALVGLVHAAKSFVKTGQDFGEGFIEGFNKSMEQIMPRFFPEGLSEAFLGEDIPKWVEAYRKFLPVVEDTTTAIQGLDDAVDNLGESMDNANFDDLLRDLEAFQRKAEDAEEDFRIQSERMLEDHLIDLERMELDYQRDVEDVINNANQDIADANREYRNNELDDEAKFQERLRQLREKYLFDLEDALRERDARQVLRLMRQYAMDKENLTREEALRQEEADRNHQEDLARIRRERDDRLRELAEEYAIKVQRENEDYELKKQREAEEHARDMEDLRRDIDERLQLFVDKLAEELGLNKEAKDELYALLQSYYGPGGFFDGLYDYSYDSMVSRAQQMLQQISAIVQQYNSVMSSMSGSVPTGSIVKALPKPVTPISTPQHFPQGFAKGGAMIAKRPTLAMFGERGPEIGSFIPMKDLERMGGMGGSLALKIMLSEGLEAQIIDTALDNVSATIEEVHRSR